MNPALNTEQVELDRLMSVLMPLIDSGQYLLALQYLEEKNVPYWRFGTLMAVAAMNRSAPFERRQMFVAHMINHASQNTEYRVFSPSHN